MAAFEEEFCALAPLLGRIIWLGCVSEMTVMMPYDDKLKLGDHLDRKTVQQYKITLLGIAPEIWRRVVVPETYTFWDFHVAIQDSMGWLDYHLHRFEALDVDGVKIDVGIPDEDDESDKTEPGWEVVLPEVFLDPGDQGRYVYDFGDNWSHEILLEGIFLAEDGVDYPLCIGGDRACPPEDCGSIPGFYRLVEILKDESHSEHFEMVRWLKEHAKNYFPYDPEHFSPKDVHFSDPEERWRMNFEFVQDLNGH